MSNSRDAWEERRTSNMNRELDSRSQWERDFARIIHCPSFRRLQGKTQVLGMGDSDFYRTRLTHSMEVAQVSAAIVSNLKYRVRKKDKFTTSKIKNVSRSEICNVLPDLQLSSAIGLAHDLGHPPYGHGGEVALNYCMRNYGGFEGNGQTLRILSRLENYVEGYGLNPTRRLLLGILKYPIAFHEAGKLLGLSYSECSSSLPWLIKAKDYKPPKCYLDTECDIVSWIFFPIENDKSTLYQKREVKNKKISSHISLDASIMEIADDICYSVHDLEDAIAIKLISKDKFNDVLDENNCNESFLKNIDEKIQELFKNTSLPSIKETFNGLFSNNSCEQKENIGRLIHILINACRLKEFDFFETPLLRLNVELANPFEELQKILGKVVRDLVILSPNVQQLEFKGQRIIIELFEAIATDPQRFLPESTSITFQNAESESNRQRVICDYIAGMTDEYAAKVYERIFCPHRGSVFDRL